MTTSKTVGEAIKMLRKQKGFTQEKLAELSGIEPRSIIAIEGGGRNPTLKTLTKVAKGLNTSLKELMN